MNPVDTQTHENIQKVRQLYETVNSWKERQKRFKAPIQQKRGWVEDEELKR